MPIEPHGSNQAGTTRDWLLVVDDDEPIRALLASALAGPTIDVVTAADGLAALRTLDQRATEPFMVVTDVLMPGIDGLSLARKLIARLARTKVVVMSGHLSNASFWPADLREVTFIAKPFALSELMELAAHAQADFHAQR